MNAHYRRASLVVEDDRSATFWSSRRPTIDLIPEPSLLHRLRPALPYAAAAIAVAAMVTGAATLATTPMMTDGVEDVAALDARAMGLAAALDPTGQNERDAAMDRKVAKMQAEMTRLRRALDQSKKGQAALAKTAAGQEEVKGLKARIAELEKTLDASRQASAGKIDELTKMVEAARAQAATVETAKAEPVKPAESPQLADLRDRVEKIEKASAATVADAGAKASDPETTGSVAPADPSSSIVKNWTVLEVRDGVARLDGRHGLIEVKRGDDTPEFGRVRAVERRDGRWVVVTERGLVLQRP
ncbi:hypothetical protein GCM10008171_08660 [Methylopila jiangsuensis]|uniref:Uncharacterized protein n=1 Tax=Methylopila jiangsuensis TaxID=586230 RepID=A0A9W6N316_9HYPH|nr:hypothetical protein [Methylopila jiangsuensis]MDR6285854.1 hypothetical protein [Methylopila jiangsuensis]GLK75612.1 hypothetical protein GCM10008171_08660 [Methylopila jiangsuensis]